MRGLLFIPAILLVAGPATAQTAPKPTQSADEIVCKLFNECGTKTYSADQKFEKAKVEQDFTFVPRNAKAAARPAATMRPPASTPKSGYVSDNARNRPMSVGSSRYTAPAAAAASQGAASPYELRVNFRLGSAMLTPEGRAQAQEFAKALMVPSVSGRRVRIEGHTDAIGTRAENLVLSRNRADAVADFLIAQGVAGDRLETAGFGFDRPLDSRTLTSPVNRRVEIVVVN